MNLPEIKKIDALPLYLPTAWQTVIFRNYGMVPLSRLAKILDTTVETIKQAAFDLGLLKISYNKSWLKRGYVTIIRNNWHLLSYGQLQILLDMDEKNLAFILKEDDFLGVKLGGFKPDVTEPKYHPLSDAQVRETAQIKSVTEKNFIPLKRQSFDFFNSGVSNNKVKKHGGYAVENRIIYSYFSLYGDVFAEEDNDSYPDYLLEKYAAMSINGIWLQGVLYLLSEFPFDKSLSKGYRERRKNLNKLIEKCKRYNIKVYLYMNEPRSVSEAIVDKYPQIKGSKLNGQHSLCTCSPQVKEYLYSAVKSLLVECPELGGIITITMSENLTHCLSKNFLIKEDICPVCRDRGAEVLSAGVNNIIQSAIDDSRSNARLIANIWGWEDLFGWDMKKTKAGIGLLDKKIDIMCVSESRKTIEKGGIKSSVGDYSISNVGPSERSAELFRYAKEKGHKIFAKMQANNSWELSAVPFIPVYGLIEQHINNLKAFDVDGLMLSWTLGGYPGGNLDFLSGFYKGGEYDSNEWFDKTFGEFSSTIKKVSGLFSEAFTEFPFCIPFLYLGPQNVGAGNLWYIKNTHLKATMVCYPYDDISGWCGVFGVEIMTSQLKKLSDKWSAGLKLLEKVAGNASTGEFITMAKVCYTHFYSAYLQCRFNLLKQTFASDKSTVAEALKIIDEETKLVKLLYNLAAQNPCIGYEASNHYYYNQNTFLEKIINLESIKAALIKKAKR